MRAPGLARAIRLLVVSNRPFLPSTAGNRERIGRLLEYLGGRGWEIGMLLLRDWGAETWDLDGMRRRLAFVELASPPRHPVARAGRVVRRTLDAMRAGGRDVDVDAWCPPWFRARVAGVVAGW